MTLTQSQMRKLQNLKSELGYSRIEHLLSQHFEQELEKEVSKLFQEMEYQVIQNLTEYYNPEVMFKAHMDLILAPIHELHKKYYEILIKYKIREFDKSRAAGKRIVERMIGFRRKGNVVNRQFTVLKAEIDLNDMVSSTISKDKLFGTSPIAHDNLRTRTYQLSEKTLARVDDNINDIITRGYDKGDGINAVANKVRRRFGQLETWEAKRIARTEIHNSQSLGVLQGYDDMGVQYIEWSSARDDRVRGLKPRDQADHYHLDGEIIQLGGVFSNGLMYPGDMNGPAKEVINCRCQVIPFIPPYGYIPPVGMAQFRESDLIAAEIPDFDEIISQAMGETPEIPIDTSSVMDNVPFFESLNNDQIREVGGVLTRQRMRAYSNGLSELERSIRNYNNAVDDVERAMYEQNIKQTRDYLRKLELDSKNARRVDVSDINLNSYVRETQSSDIKTINELEQRQIDAQRKIVFTESDIDGMDFHLGPNYTDLTGYIYDTKEFHEVLDNIATQEGKEMFIKNIEEKLNQIKTIMNKSPGSTQDTIYFRGGKLDDLMEVGEVGTLDAPTSTSYREATAKKFVEEDEYLIEVYAPKGTKGIVVNDGRFHKHTSSHEYTLAPGQEYVLVDIDRVNKTAKILLI